MKKHCRWDRLTLCGTLALILTFTAVGCSSSRNSSDDDDDDQAAVDAGTDAVPSSDAENTGAQASTEEASNAAPNGGDSAGNPGRISADASDSQVPPPPADSGQPQAMNSAPVAAAAPPAEPAPIPVPPPASAMPTSSGSETYTVHSGDTLMRIAFEHYGDLYKWRDIYEANRDKIKNPNLIYPGVVLNLSGASNQASIPNGEKYEIKSGDTLGTIAKNVYGSEHKWRELWQFNQSIVQDPNKIFAGFFVYYSREVARRAAATAADDQQVADATPAQAPAQPESAQAAPQPVAAPPPMITAQAPQVTAGAAPSIPQGNPPGSPQRQPATETTKQ